MRTYLPTLVYTWNACYLKRTSNDRAKSSCVLKLLFLFQWTLMLRKIEQV